MFRRACTTKWGSSSKKRPRAAISCDGAGLQPSSAGTRVRLKGGKITVTDGPLHESKEIIGGYAIIDAKSREEALGLARRFMELHQKHWPTFEGECEMRPLEEEVQPCREWAFASFGFSLTPRRGLLV